MDKDGCVYSVFAHHLHLTFSALLRRQCVWRSRSSKKEMHLTIINLMLYLLNCHLVGVSVYLSICLPACYFASLSLPLQKLNRMGFRVEFCSGYRGNSAEMSFLACRKVLK